jgi:hypothetical protein
MNLDLDKERFDRIIAATSKDALEQAKTDLMREMDSNNVYPSYSQASRAYTRCLLYWIGELRDAACKLNDKYELIKHKEQAVSWAAECTLTERDENGRERWESFLVAVEIIENALRSGMDYDQLRKHLKDGITEQEIEQKCFLEPENV